MTNHIKETSLDPHCLDDIGNDDLKPFTRVDDSVFILLSASCTVLLITVIVKIIKLIIT